MRAFSLRPMIVPLIVACALFMEHLDSTVIATALPMMAKSLHTDPLRLNLAITSYMLSLAMFIPLSGWVADRFGTRTIFRMAIVVFMIGSVLCGISQGFWGLIVARVLQGLGGAMMVPVGRLALLKSVARTQLVGAMTWLSAPALIGPILGPPLGGFIVTYFSWRWIFFVNIPIGLLGIVLAGIYMKDTRQENQEPLDVRGFLLMALGIGGLVFGCETAGHGLLPGTMVAGLMILGSAFLGLYYLHARRVAHPIIDPKLRRFPAFWASVVAGSIYRVCVGALPFLVPLMLQIGFGVSPARSGFLTLAGALGAIFMKGPASFILRVFGFRRVLIAGVLINALFLALPGFFRPDTAHEIIFFTLLVGGFFRSVQFTALNAVAYADVPTELISRANTFYSMMQQLSLSFGVTFGAFLLYLTLLARGHGELGPADFWPAYATVAALLLFALPFFLAMHPHAGADISGHAPPRGDAA